LDDITLYFECRINKKNARLYTNPIADLTVDPFRKEPTCHLKALG